MTQMNRPYYMVMDVESVGLHGPAFWVGYVVVDPEGHEHDSNSIYFDPSLFSVMWYDAEDMDWVKKNIAKPNPNKVTIAGSTRSMRDIFWSDWMKWRNREAWLAADVAWPVEGHFLNQCIKDDEPGRKWLAPYPLIDVASVRLAKGLDPLATNHRFENELPQHDPLADARQSARLLLEALKL